MMLKWCSALTATLALEKKPRRTDEYTTLASFWMYFSMNAMIPFDTEAMNTPGTASCTPCFASSSPVGTSSRS